MKVKLLKKIRKRFDWYINSSGSPILIDKVKRTSSLIDYKSILIHINKNEDYLKTIEVDLKEWEWRWLKISMIEEFGYNYNNIIYTSCLNLSKTKNRSLKR